MSEMVGFKLEAGVEQSHISSASDSSHEEQHENGSSGSSGDAEFIGHQKSKRISRGSQRRPNTRDDHWKKLQRFYSDKYVDLLKEMDPENGTDVRHGPNENYDAQQFGMVIWTAEEKRAFFQALSHRGRHDIKAIVTSVKTKSELEVVAYLKLLHDQSSNQNVSQLSSDCPTLVEIPAALEIGPSTEALLDSHAEALCMYQENVDNAVGRQRDPKFWLIDQSEARKLDEIIQGAGEVDIGQLVPEAALLNLTNWTGLSERVFMNSAGSQGSDNWRNVAFGDETPAITREAIAEFHDLVISLTRRLLQATLIVAQSRLRMNHRGRTHAVTIEDVQSALEILGMPASSWKYWYEAPRRCQLQIKLPGQKGRTGGNTDYDEVEEVLLNWRQGRSSSRSSRGSQQTESTRNRSDQELSENAHDSRSVASGSEDDYRADEENQEGESEDFRDSDIESETTTRDAVLDDTLELENGEPLNGEISDDFEDISDDPSSWTGNPHAVDVSQHRIEGRYHTIAQQRDLEEGREDELRLWKYLGKESPRSLENSAHGPQEQKWEPAALRKSRNEPADWTEEALGKSFWEEYCHGEEVPDMPASKRRRRLTAHDSISSQSSE